MPIPLTAEGDLQRLECLAQETVRSADNGEFIGLLSRYHRRVGEPIKDTQSVLRFLACRLAYYKHTTSMHKIADMLRCLREECFAYQMERLLLEEPPILVQDRVSFYRNEMCRITEEETLPVSLSAHASHVADAETQSAEFLYILEHCDHSNFRGKLVDILKTPFPPDAHEHIAQLQYMAARLGASATPALMRGIISLYRQGRTGEWEQILSEGHTCYQDLARCLAALPLALRLRAKTMCREHPSLSQRREEEEAEIYSALISAWMDIVRRLPTHIEVATLLYNLSLRFLTGPAMLDVAQRLLPVHRYQESLLS